MLIRLEGGRVVDPAHDRDGIGDLWIRDGRIAAPPPRGVAPDVTYDVSGKIVMAGGIDIHSHIASGNVNMARLLLPELRVRETPAPPEAPFATAGWSAAETGRLYAEMGFTTVVEPAVPPSLALRTHLELDDIPIIDRAGLVVLGSDDFFLSLLREAQSAAAVRDYVGYILAATRCLGVKTINAGGAAAFKDNARRFGLDDVVPSYGVSSRAIVAALQDCVEALGVRHPLHVHCNNLGVTGAVDTVAATAAAADGLPMHLTHVQFYCYEPARRGISSGAEKLIRALASHSNITLDVGQVMFGRTATISLDTLRQFDARATARPRKWIVWDGDAEGGGILPFDYRAASPVNALQWAIGLEIFLLAPDPWRVFFTTDHPNGAHFTTYPKILHLLMDAGERARWIETLPKAAMARTGLPSLTREYSLREVAILTRASPARLLGLQDRGQLAPEAIADVAVYTDQPDRTAMFSAAHLVFKDGVVVVRDGEVVNWTRGRTETVKPDYDPHILRRLAAYTETTWGLPPESLVVNDAAFGPGTFREHSCRS